MSATRTPARHREHESATTRSSLLRAAFLPVRRAQTWRNLAYNFLTLPLGILYFLYLFVGLAFGIATAIIYIGVIVLLIMAVLNVYLADIDRQGTNILLRTNLPHISGRREKAIPHWPQEIKPWLRDLVTWQSTGYLVFRIVQAAIVTSIVIGPFGAMIEGLVGSALVGLAPLAGIEHSHRLAFWTIDTPTEAWPALIICFAGLIAMFHVSNAAARIAGELAAAIITLPATIPAAPTTHPAAHTPVHTPVEPPPGIDTAPVAPPATAAEPIAPPVATEPQPAAPVTTPGILIDEEQRLVQVDGAEVELTRKEFDLLALMARNPGRAFHREELLDRVWSDNLDVTDRTIDTHIQRLRRKLGPRATVVETVRGVGYRYRERPQDA